MKCPKCNHEQTDKIECENCGIIFAKIVNPDDNSIIPNSPPPAKQQPPEKPDSFRTIAAMVTLLIIFSAGGYWFGSTRNNSGEISGRREPPGILNQETSSPESPGANDPPSTSLPSRRSDNSSYGDSRFSKKLDHARNATVFVRSSWGSGSGFFIDEDGHIITNRHVVEPRKDEVDRLESRMKKLLTMSRSTFGAMAQK